MEVDVDAVLLQLKYGSIRLKVGCVGFLGERHQGIALDLVAGIQKECPGRIVGAFLLNERCQLGVADVGALCEVVMGIIVMKDGYRCDAASEEARLASF